jgi:hypothetical protein
MGLAFKYLERHNAILESDYSYVSGISQKPGVCDYDSKPHTDVSVISQSNVSPNNDTFLKASIELGPTSVAIQAD